MKLIELTKKYTFHDSIVKSLEWDTVNKRFLMAIDFCNWAQDYYTNDMEENIVITLVFCNVEKVRGSTIKIDYNGISTCDSKDDSIIFWLLRDYPDGDGGIDEVQIRADAVTTKPLLA